MPLSAARNKGLGVRRKNNGQKRAYNLAYHEGTLSDPVVLSDDSVDPCMPDVIVVSSDSDATKTMIPPPGLNSAFRSSLNSDSSIDTYSTFLDDEIDVELKGNKKCGWDVQEKNRSAIVCLYEKKYNSPNRCEWSGKNGVVAKITSDLPGVARNTIKSVLHKHVNMLESETEKRRSRAFLGELLIGSGSEDRQLIADCTEKGYGLDRTWVTVNNRRKAAGLVLVGRHVV